MGGGENMKKVAVVMMILCGLVLYHSPAYAANVAFDFDGLYDWGTSYSYNGGTDTWEAGTAANPSNPFDGSVSQDLANGVITAPDGKEDSFGIARINTIINLDSSTTMFDRATAPYELTVLFYGFDDTYLNGTAGFSTLLSRGGRALVYRDFAKDYNPATPPNAGTDRTAADQMNTITEGTLLLDLKGHQLTDPVGGDFTLENNFNFTTYRGTGSVYFDVVGGAWQSLYDTNALNDGADINFAFSAFPSVINQPGILDSRNWLVKGTGEGQAFLIPEPMSMFMVTMGVFGVALTQRKRKKTV